MSGRILRATLAENDPTMLNVTLTTKGKLLIKNAGNFDLWVGYDQYDVTLATGVNYFVIDAGVTFVFVCLARCGFLISRSRSLVLVSRWSWRGSDLGS